MKLPFTIISKSRWSELLSSGEKLSRQIQSLADSFACVISQLEESRRTVRELRWQMQHAEQRVRELEKRKLDKRERRNS